MKNTNRSPAGSFVVAQFALFLSSPPLISKHRRTSVWNVHLLITLPCQGIARVAMVRPLFNWQRCVPIFSYFTPQPVRPQGLVSGTFPDSLCLCVCICVCVFSFISFPLVSLDSCLFLSCAAVSHKDRLGSLTLRWQLHYTVVLLQLSLLKNPQGQQGWSLFSEVNATVNSACTTYTV